MNPKLSYSTPYFNIPEYNPNKTNMVVIKKMIYNIINALLILQLICIRQTLIPQK